MRSPWAALAFVLLWTPAVIGSFSTLARHHPGPPIPVSSPTPVAVQTPTPATATPVVNVTPAEGSSGDQVTVSGSSFPPGNRVQLYFDGTNHPLGASVVVGNDGTFQQPVTVPAGATQAVHQICAQANSQSPACAQYQVIAAATTPTPSPALTPTPTTNPSLTPGTATPNATTSPAPQGILGELFPGLLIVIGVLLVLAIVALILIFRGRGKEPPDSPAGRGPGRPTVTHRSPRGYRGAGEPEGDGGGRGYRRRSPQVGGRPDGGAPLEGPGGDAPGLPGGGRPGLPGENQPGLPGDSQRGLPGDSQRGLPGSQQRGLPGGEEGGGRSPRRGPSWLPPGPDDPDDDPFSRPPRR